MCYNALLSDYTMKNDPCMNGVPPQPICQATCYEYYNNYNLLLTQDCHMLNGTTMPLVDADSICAGLPTEACVKGNAVRTGASVAAMLAIALLHLTMQIV